MLLCMVSTCLATVEALEKNLLQSSPKKKIENENTEIEECDEQYFKIIIYEKNINADGNWKLTLILSMLMF